LGYKLRARESLKGDSNLAIESIFAYLVHPGRGVQEPQAIAGAEVPHQGLLFNLVSEIYGAEPGQRDIEIAFNPSADGQQNNECRTLVLAHTQAPTIVSGRLIATRLQGVSDNRAGLGLLFLIVGAFGLDRKFVGSRFPAESAILAELEGGNLNVEFLERVFVKRATAYKAVTFQNQNPAHGFWQGRATDRQITAQEGQISQYWISDFLNAGFLVTPAAGTNRLAKALRGVIKSTPNLSIKREIASLVTLAPGALGNAPTSITQVCNHFGLSPAARQAIEAEVKSAPLMNEQFGFDANEFHRIAPYRSIELDNGAILTAPSDNFDAIFTEEEVGADGLRRYTTEGHLSDERIVKRAI
jgi:hypothetical protein